MITPPRDAHGAFRIDGKLYVLMVDNPHCPGGRLIDLEYGSLHSPAEFGESFESVNLTARLQWTTSRPTEPGHYWAQSDELNPFVVEIIKEKNGNLWIYHGSDVLPFGSFSRFAGPIEGPQ